MLQQDDARTRVDGFGRFKELLAVATLPLLTGYAAVATVLATVAALAAEPSFSATGVLLAAGPGWLAAYQVPVVIGDNELGLLPLALTIGVVALVVRAASGAAERLDFTTPRQAGVVIGTVASTHAVVGVTIAVLANGAVVTADPLDAFGVPGLVSGVAATVGVARRCGLLDAVHPYVDDAAIAGMRAAALGMAGLLAAASVLLTAATALAVPTMQTLFAAHVPGFGSGFGMLLLCLGYLPNALLAVLAFLLGPGFTLGTTSLGPLYFEGGPVPAVPVLAGLPESYAVWWPALLVLPALTGAGVGWRLRASATAPVERLRSVAVVGAVIGFATVVLTTLAGGSLGGGPFPGLMLPAGLLSVAAFAWIFVPGALVAWLAGPHPGFRRRRSDAVSDVPDAVSDAQDAVFDAQDAEFDVADAVSDAQDGGDEGGDEDTGDEEGGDEGQADESDDAAAADDTTADAEDRSEGAYGPAGDDAADPDEDRLEADDGAAPAEVVDAESDDAAESPADSQDTETDKDASGDMDDDTTGPTATTDAEPTGSTQAESADADLVEPPDVVRPDER